MGMLLLAVIIIGIIVVLGKKGNVQGEKEADALRADVPKEDNPYVATSVNECLAWFCYEVDWIREHDDWRGDLQVGSIAVWKNNSGCITIEAFYNHEFSLCYVYNKHKRKDGRVKGMSINDDSLRFSYDGIDERDRDWPGRTYLNVKEISGMLGSDVIIKGYHNNTDGGGTISFTFQR